MKQRIIDAALSDITQWPQLCLDVLPEPKSKKAKKRILALKLYLAGKCHAVIRAATGLSRRCVRRVLMRALSKHADGRIWGLRACVPYARVDEYHRSAPSPAIDRRATHGHAGLLLRLLDRYPIIRERVVDAALDAGSGEFTEAVFRGDKVHLVFIEECIRAKIPRHEYPFNVENQGADGLREFLKKEMALRNLRRSVNASFGEEAARKLGSSWEAVRQGSHLQCYQRVEFDGYRVDCIATIRIPDPKGGPPIFLPLERIWILVVVEVTSRAVLGYHVCLGRHYSAEDVLTCIENSITPWKPRELSTPGLSYSADGGLPSGVIPELAFAKWAELAIDNDRSNCAKWVWDRVQEKVGCLINPGPVRTPKRRQYVERFFRSVAQNVFQRLPTTTGSSPTDPKRRDPEAAAVRHEFTLDELLDLVDVVVARYNGIVTSALYNRSPLQYLRFAIADKRFFIRQVPESARASFTLTLKRTTLRVRGNLKKGVRPYVQFEGVRYYSERLGNLPALIGKPAIVECNTRDLRVLTLFLPTGEEIDKIQVSQAWTYHAHDLRTRKAILRCIRLGKFSRRDAEDPVRSFMKAKAAESFSAKKPRNELAHVIRVKGDIRALPPPAASPAVPPEKPQMRRRAAPRVTVPMRSTNY